ncbi:hypothetical protein QQ045_015788 [Rhodiola kirilowii]
MMTDKELTGSIRGEAKGFLKALRAFEFVFCLLLTNRIMGITDLLCQALQKHSQDIVNAMNLVSSTKALLQALRDDGWDSFYRSVQQFGEHHGLEMPNMDAAYSMGTGRGCQQHDVVTNEHYYHFDVFNVIIDVQLMELHDRFTEQGIELLTLSSAFDPKNQFKNFDMEKICRLAEKFYPKDFDASEVRALMLQLEHYKHQVVFDKDFQKLSSLAQLCRRLVEVDLAKLFPLVDRLIRLVLTLPVSTATTERAFSAMKIIKTRLRNKMEDGYLSGCMMLHIEKEYVDDIDSETVIDHFEFIGDRLLNSPLERNHLGFEDGSSFNSLENSDPSTFFGKPGTKSLDDEVKRRSNDSQLVHEKINRPHRSVGFHDYAGIVPFQVQSLDGPVNRLPASDYKTSVPKLPSDKVVEVPNDCRERHTVLGKGNNGGTTKKKRNSQLKAKRKFARESSPEIIKGHWSPEEDQ